MIIDTPGVAATPDMRAKASPENLRAAAEAFEAAFVAEMLSHAGLGETPAAMGGGAGEDAFGSLLVREQARLLVESGGLGLADAIEAALRRRQFGDHP